MYTRKCTVFLQMSARMRYGRIFMVTHRPRKYKPAAITHACMRAYIKTIILSSTHAHTQKMRIYAPSRTSHKRNRL